MGFRNGAYATIFEDVDNGGRNYTAKKVAISKRNADGGYDQTFGGIVRFVGDCKNDAAKLTKLDRIKIEECDVTNSYDKEKKREYVNYVVFKFSKLDKNGNTTGGAAKKQEDNSSMDDYGGTEGELPF